MRTTRKRAPLLPRDLGDHPPSTHTISYPTATTHHRNTHSTRHSLNTHSRPDVHPYRSETWQAQDSSKLSRPSTHQPTPNSSAHLIHQHSRHTSIDSHASKNQEDPAQPGRARPANQQSPPTCRQARKRIPRGAGMGRRARSRKRAHGGGGR